MSMGWLGPSVAAHVGNWDEGKLSRLGADAKSALPSDPCNRLSGGLDVLRILTYCDFDASGDVAVVARQPVETSTSTPDSKAVKDCFWVSVTKRIRHSLFAFRIEIGSGSNATAPEGARPDQD